MGNRKSFYLGSDAELYTGGQRFTSLIASSASTYNVPATLVTRLTNQMSIYGPCYLAAIDPQTRTKSSVEYKNEQKKILKSIIAEVARAVNANPEVTNQQRIDLGLAVRKAPARRNAPETSPTVDIEHRVANSVFARAHDGSPGRQSKPADVSEVLFFSHVGPEAPTDPAVWRLAAISGRTVAEIEFPTSLPAGTQVWITACYRNARGMGPGSAPISTVLAGGTSTLKLVA